MRPINKKELEKAVEGPVRMTMTKWVHVYCSIVAPRSPAYWIRLGYDIARRRAESGKEL